MTEPTRIDAQDLHGRLSAVPSMPHRGPYRERIAVLLKALKQAYEAGQADAVDSEFAR